MVFFCPNCGNVLLVENAGVMRYFCATCPYVRAITQELRSQVPLQRKEVDDVLGGEAAWRSAQRTAATCEKCGCKEAFFMQIQIRSADEPMTTFYKCANFDCGFMWKDG